VRAALELLDGSKKTVNQLRGNFQTIDQCGPAQLECRVCAGQLRPTSADSVVGVRRFRLCEECSSLIENHDTIEVLNTVLANLNNTIEVRPSKGRPGGVPRWSHARSCLSSSAARSFTHRSSHQGLS
jgi:hypothetical protein